MAHPLPARANAALRMDTFLHGFGLTLQVFTIDLLLSGDNAVVIALACRHLPPPQMRRAMSIGIGAAVAARIVLTALASVLMALPLLRLVGAVVLVWIAIKLLVDAPPLDGRDATLGEQHSADLWSAAGTIAVANIAMSLDNVVALAAVSQGGLLVLFFGLLLSVPLLMFGSLFVTALLARYPVLVRAGSALLGWLAGDIAVGDPLIAEGVAQQAPLLVYLVPVLAAVFVLAESRIIETRRLLVTPPRRATVRVDPLPLPVAAIDAGPAAAPLPTPAPFGDSRRWLAPLRRALPWAGGAAAVAGIAVLVYSARMPPPEDLNRFVCPDRSTIYFRHGGDVVRMSYDAATIRGLLRFGRIDWGDYQAATKTLGFLPPTEITYDDARRLRINGGRYVNISCEAQ